jgi:hypothetical protein
VGGRLKAMFRSICIFAAGLLVLALVLAAGGFLWVSECSLPSSAALRSLVPGVRLAEAQELAATGRLDGIDAKLRAWYPGGLRHYRVAVGKTGADYEVAVEPTGWCFCRATFILRHGGQDLEIIEPLLGNGR